MDRIAQLSPEERSDVFTETAVLKQMTPAIVEKDFWVVWTLDKLFTEEWLSKELLFKGGTSLSKVYDMIERFSEDIDLVLDWTETTAEDPLADRGTKKQDRIIEEMVAGTEELIVSEIIPRLQRQVGEICEVKLNADDPQTIDVIYPKSFSDEYLTPVVKLEIGPRGAWIPSDYFDVTSYAAEAFPKLFSFATTRVRAIEAKRTFWEKATILHQEAHRETPKDKSRLSRHYYDMYQLAGSVVKDEALGDIELLKNVIKYKKKFFRCGWAKYDDALPGTFKLIPPEHILASMRKDYVEMRNMIYGDYPDFNKIIVRLADVEAEINRLKYD